MSQQFQNPTENHSKDQNWYQSRKYMTANFLGLVQALSKKVGGI